MTPEVFDVLLERVRPAIEKQDTVMRQAIPAKIRLMLTLTYLTSGANFRVIEDLYRISHSTISKIVPEVCGAIWNSLSADYIKCPTTPEEWKEKAKGFAETWDYPRGLAAIDGKHVVVQVQKLNTHFFCRKGRLWRRAVVDPGVIVATLGADVDIHKSGLPYDSSPFISSPVVLSWSFRPLVILYPVIWSPGHLVPWLFCPLLSHHPFPFYMCKIILKCACCLLAD
jgi:hypothetical protein